MRRGDIVTVALQGSHGKPRPALIVQSDLFATSSQVAVLPLTSFEADVRVMRIAIEASEATGLLANSYAMLDRVTTTPRERVGKIIGHADPSTILAIDRALAVYFGLA